METARRKNEQEVETIRKICEDLHSDKTELEKTIKSYEKTVEKLKDFGLLKDESDSKEEQVSYTENYVTVNQGEWISELNRIAGFISSKDGIYPRELINKFAALMKTHDMVVLAGRSGSGKTSFCRLFGKAIGAKVFVVPVKPNWMSTDDLIGYYNPIDQTYISTEFSDALREASKNLEQIYIIVLDEMNISKPEYYFADFLSRLEDRRDSELAIDIPSAKDQNNSNKEELRGVAKLVCSMLESREDLSLYEILKEETYREMLAEALKDCKQSDQILHEILNLSLKAYKNSKNTISKLPIPENVRIIGTINVDDTTHFFSPKVLDRVHILKLDDPLDVPLDSRCQGVGFEKNISSASFGHRLDYPAYEENDSLSHSLKALRESAKGIGIDVSLRVMRQALQYKQALRSLGLPLGSAFSTIVQTKLLPRMVFDAESSSMMPDIGKKADALEKFLSDLEKAGANEACLQEARKLLKQARNGDNQVNYWAL